jgi:hypothetical protein
MRNDGFSESTLAPPAAQPLTPIAQRLEENIGGAGLALTQDDLRNIESAVSDMSMQGARYPEHLAKLVGR